MSSRRMHMDCMPDKCWLGDESPCALFDDPPNPTPELEVMEYVVFPSEYQLIPFSDKHSFCFYIHNSGWGWSVRDFSGGQGRAMNRKGQFIMESRGHKGNKRRRYTLEEATSLAYEWVDKYKRFGGKCAADFVREAKEKTSAVPK